MSAAALVAVGSADRAAPAARAGGTAASPRAVTRGESAGQLPKQRAKVDWLNATFPGPDRYSMPQFVALLGKLFRRPLMGIEGRGIFGFDRSVKLLASVGSRTFPIGCIAFGGEAQRGRWMLQFTGAGCQVVRDWHKLARLLKALEARITRLDLAVDFLEGEYTVDDAVAMHEAGAFTSQGRPPSTTVAGDWLDKVKGRTLYVGNASNGKLLRVYEKGRQLGDFTSDWVRFEVQLGNRDRIIPFDALTRRDDYFAGCYPALRDMLDTACAESIKTKQTAGAMTISHALFHLKRSYGKWLGVVTGPMAADVAELVQSCTVIGAPRRLLPSAIDCGLTWAQLLARLKGIV